MISAARKRANEKWDKNNKDRVNYLKSRSSATSFFRTKATREDLLYFKELVDNLLKGKEEPVKKIIPLHKKYTTYSPECEGFSKYKIEKKKAWGRIVTGIDLTQSWGYIFKGDPINVREELEVETGSIIVEHISGVYTLYKAEANNQKSLIAAIDKTELKSKLKELIESKKI